MRILCRTEIPEAIMHLIVKCKTEDTDDEKFIDKFTVQGQGEIDFEIEIFEDLKNHEDLLRKRLIRSCVTIQLPSENMDKGALLLDMFELYLLDINNNFEGNLAKYVADAEAHSFVSHDMDRQGHLGTHLFYGFSTVNTFQSLYLSR